MPEINLDKYQHILVVDLEATCCDSKSIPRHQMETIEIGAVMVNTASLTGTHHRGIDDARNISKLLPYILGRKTV